MFEPFGALISPVRMHLSEATSYSIFGSGVHMAIPTASLLNTANYYPQCKELNLYVHYCTQILSITILSSGKAPSLASVTCTLTTQPLFMAISSL